MLNNSYDQWFNSLKYWWFKKIPGNGVKFKKCNIHHISL
ncbi:hypothetical protein SA22_0214 [Salmonella enterica subsp. enterica serovar Agona str. 22.H.04]|uniref:Uncharacterized protein n=2 Tax=Salmonella enterica I TaxID=59201 RepID=B5F4W2_SALA4|nr:hypothetical protein SeAg_B3167 [Salmonella enterica subsp. enterica serovar Agona str. SL483]EHC83034.1 hypothetical protein LTSESEN_4695 [Salmonella enterica subsp. enterica serovar Senftenberg str. A4-543]QDQ30835.1 hypothetical protein FORC098_0957 [Salmonella enterica subsp. enterica serovar Typhimurium]CCQ99228.1 hypothetical protein SA73_0436 [Salmonella enterica subsp. enterica serovar Agona str. 73.H.09]CCR03785.1 hypothetical protein SA72_0333 [Salmonella enterica subsp. enterica s